MSISGATEMRRRRAWSRRAFSAGHLHRRVRQPALPLRGAGSNPRVDGSKKHLFLLRLGRAVLMRSRVDSAGRVGSSTPCKAAFTLNGSPH